MNQYHSISDLKDNAKGLLTGQFGNAVLVNLLPSLFTFAITFCISMFFSTISTVSMVVNNPEALESMLATGAVANTAQGIGSAIGSYLLDQVIAVFTGVFSTGIALYFLNVACGRTASISNLFYGYKYLFKQSITISLVNVLVSTVCLMPYNVFYAMYMWEHSEKWLLYTGVSLVLGGLIYLPIALSLSQAYFLLLDFPGYSAKEILRLSIRLMKGRKKKLFLIELSFLPLLLLGMLSFGIGDLWINPYLNMTMALYFLDIMKSGAER